MNFSFQNLVQEILKQARRLLHLPYVLDDRIDHFIINAFNGWHVSELPMMRPDATFGG